MLSFQISNFSDWKSIGEGSFGSVFKAFHGPTSTWMAIKEVKILDTEEPYLKNLQNEMDILFSCSNTVPQEVKYYGTFWLDNSIYICMEYMDLGSLTSWWFQTHNITYENRTEILDRTNFPGLKFESPLPPTYAFPEFVLKYISFYVATSLKFLNEKLGIIHKDIKPSNILFNSKAEVKLCDFGISSSLEEPDSQKGCPSYMPPELLISKEDLLKRRWIIIPHKIDVWSLGITLIELASGRYPFPISSHDSVLAQIYMIINGEPIISLSDEFSELFVDFVKKCLLKNPLERASMQELLVCAIRWEYFLS